eukprot:gene11332-3366_t
MPSTKSKAPSSAKEKEKKASRPTRCGPGFEWKPQPKLVDAAEKNDVDRLQRLLVRGEDPNEALHFAIGRGRLSAVNLLLQAGASVHTEIKDDDYWVPPPVKVNEHVERRFCNRYRDGTSAKTKGKKGKGKKSKKKKAK